MAKLLKYRGHIRGWRKLCEELSIQVTDREEREQQIILRSYETWGEDLWKHVAGSYAFALYDESKEELFAMRDPFGTKSFYYYETKDGRLLIGTSIAEILSQPGFEKELNESMLQLYLSMTYVPGENTFYKGLNKLMGGCSLTFKEGKLSIHRYWSPQFAPDESKSLEDWAEEIHKTVAEIIPETFDEDDYVESFLSGGVDSSYLAAMSDHVKVTNSASFEDKKFDESYLAAETARVLGKENRKCVVSPEEYRAAIPKVVRWLEQPLGDASTIVLALACERVREHTAICYSGEGIDEFFGGYKIYKTAEKYGETVRTHYIGNTNIIKEDEKKRLLQHYDESVYPLALMDDVYKYLNSDDPLTWMMAIDIRIWLEGDIYFAIDKLGLGSGLEVRMPFTDLRMFDIASRLPSNLKVTQDADKIAFRHAAAKVLPEEVAFRTKMGFPVPIRLWLAEEDFARDIREKFEGEAAGRYFHREEILALLDSFLGGEDMLWRKVWTIYIFLVWYEVCFEAA